MRASRFCVMLLALVGAFVAPAKGQRVWDTTMSQGKDFSLQFRAISCNGQNCTASYSRVEYKLARTFSLFARSSDGGKHWSTQDPGLGVTRGVAEHEILAVQQIDSLNIVGVGDSGLIVRTTNGGATWSMQQLSGYSLLKDVHFSDAQNGILVGTAPPVVATTGNGGVSWQISKFSPSQVCFSCHSYGNGRFRAMGTSVGPMYSTQDNWATVDSGETLTYAPPDGLGGTFALQECSFGTGDTILGFGAVFRNRVWGMIIKSTDGGKHWLAPKVFDSIFSGLSCLTSPDRDTIYGGSDLTTGRLLFSADHGDHWRVDSMSHNNSVVFNGAVGLAYNSNGDLLAALVNQLAIGVHSVSSVETFERIVYGTRTFPNPASSVINIRSVDVDETVTLVDMLGREVASGRLSAEGTLSLNVATQPRGIYAVMLHHDGHSLPIGKIALVHG